MFEECKQERQLFNSVDDWFSHMQWQHTLEWTCQAPGHEDHVFHSPSSFEQHIRSHHAGSFTESQLPILISKSAKPSSSTFRICPLCHEDLAVLRPLTGADISAGIAAPTQAPNFRHHIAQHLEALALLSLPGRADLDECVSNERQSQSVDLSTLAEKETFPTANFADDSIEVLMSAASTADKDIPDMEIDWAHIQQELQRSRNRYPTPSQDSNLKPFILRAQDTSNDIDESSQSPILVAVIGQTGTGKSSFINKATGASLEVGRSLESCTRSYS